MSDLKIAIVTGASSGLGKEFTKQIEFLYKELDEIWVIARRRERLEELKSCIFTNVRIFEGDLLEEDIYKSIKKKLEKKQPNVRMLVNAAGFGKIGTVKEISCEDQLRMIELNCMSLTHMTKLCLPYMSKGSRIVNVASAAAFCPQPSFSVYAATKSYVLSFSRSLRTELSDEEIYVTAVCPGPVKTEFFEVAGQKEQNPMKAAVMAEPEAVVKQALLDAKDGKEMSVYGMAMKGTKTAAKLLPHSVILKAMKKFW